MTKKKLNVTDLGLSEKAINAMLDPAGDQQEEAPAVDLEKIVKKNVQKKKKELVRERGAAYGLPVGTTRKTFIIKEDALDRLLDYAYTERIKLKDVLTIIVNDYIDQYEQNGGKLLHRDDK